jgi:hypothetical protein
MDKLGAWTWGLTAPHHVTEEQRFADLILNGKVIQKWLLKV